MRLQDRAAFFKAAKNKFWILVRDTNVFSLIRIGDRKFAPKEIDCKAKTANNPSHKLRGLVVDPYTHPDAFSYSLENVGEARKYWDKMDFRSGKYTVDRDKNSFYYGCLMCKGKYIHGDYDLYDIIDITQPHRNLSLVSEMNGMEHRVGANLWKVMKIINDAIGTPMVQHGGEAQFKKHTNQKIHALGPHGEYVFLDSLSKIENFYKEELKGRLTSADSFGNSRRAINERDDLSNVVKIDDWKARHRS